MDGPAPAHEVPDTEERKGKESEAEAAVQHELNLPIGEKPHHRSRNGAIGVRGAKLSHSIGPAAAAST